MEYAGIADLDDIDEEDSSGDDLKLTAADVEDVLLYTLDWSVQSLLERIGTSFDINPSFQRRDAWQVDRKSLYIESLILGLPVPQIVLAEDRDVRGRFIVLDGKQRLVTTKQFAAPDDKFPALRLRKMEFLSELNGMTMEDMRHSSTATSFVENFLSQPVRTIVVRNWGSEAVLYHVFRRLNQGSLPLSPQELRQSLFPGPFSNWIDERSSNSSSIHRARRIKGEDFRMRDAEMLLRGVAFLDGFERYNGRLREFLDDASSIGNRRWSSSSERYISIADSIETAIARTEIIFGQEYAFLRYDKDKYIRRFNIAVYDTMTMVLSSPELTDGLVEASAAKIRSGFERLCVEDPRFEGALVSTTKTAGATSYRVLRFADLVARETGVDLVIKQRANDLLERSTKAQ